MNDRDNKKEHELWFKNEFPDDYLLFIHDSSREELIKFINSEKSWQASANREGYKLVPVEMSWQKADDLAMDEWNNNKELFKSQNRDLTAIEVQDFRLKWCRNKAHQIMNDYKAMIGAVDEST